MLFHFRYPRTVVPLLAAALLAITTVHAAETPEVSVNQPTEKVYAKDWFEVGVTVRWDGDSTRFNVTPGSLEAPGWGEAGWDRVEARPDKDSTELHFVARFKANAPGSVSIPALTLNYTDPSEAKTAPPTPPAAPGATPDPNAAPAPAPEQPVHTLATEAFNVEVHADRRALYTALLAGIVLVGIVGAAVSYALKRRKAATNEQEDALAPWQTVEDALHNARRHRLDGDFYKFYRELQRLVDFAGGEVKSEFGARLARRVEEVGFKGQVPTDDELDGILKDIERALARWKEGKQS